MQLILEAGVKNKRFGICILWLSVAIFTLATGKTALAQADISSLSGSVTDVSGALVPGAKITVSNNATLAERSITSNESGSFTLTNLAPGDYSVRVEKGG